MDNKSKWYGEGCKYQICKFEEYCGFIDESEPILVYCNNKNNIYDYEGNCCKQLCPIKVKKGGCESYD